MPSARHRLPAGTHGCEADLQHWELEIASHIFAGTFLDGVSGAVVDMRRSWLGAQPILTEVVDLGRVLVVELTIHSGERLRGGLCRPGRLAARRSCGGRLPIPR